MKTRKDARGASASGDVEFESWMAAELATPMSAEWIEEDLEATPVAEISIVDGVTTIGSDGFCWNVPDAAPHERSRVRDESIS